LIRFDFNDRYEDEAAVGSAISRREGFVMSVIAHALVAAALMFAPELDLFQPSPDEAAQAAERIPEEDRTFVFVQPRVDIEALRPPPQAALSDIDREAQTPMQAPQPDNPQPFALGNSAERTEAAPEERARGEESPQPAAQPQLESQIARAPCALELLCENLGEMARVEQPGLAIGLCLLLECGDHQRAIHQHQRQERWNNKEWVYPPKHSDDRAKIDHDEVGQQILEFQHA
jgi:hypothetical protein